MKQVWQSNDGKIFQTEQSCLEYEQFGAKIKELAPMVQSDLDWEYVDDLGAYIMYRDDAEVMAEWIIRNFDKLKRMIDGAEYA